MVLAFDQLCVCGVTELAYPSPDGLSVVPQTWPTHWQLVPMAPMLPAEREAHGLGAAAAGCSAGGGADGEAGPEAAVKPVAAALPPDVQVGLFLTY